LPIMQSRCFYKVEVIIDERNTLLSKAKQKKIFFMKKKRQKTLAIDSN
jgi:hypothetical protein